MSEPESAPLTAEQVRLLDSAVAFWAEGHPLPDYRAFAFADEEPFSPRELARALHFRESSLAEHFLRMIQFALEAESFEGILGDFYRAGETGWVVT